MFNFNRRINGKTYYKRLLVGILIMLSMGLVVDLLPDESTPSGIITIIFIIALVFWMVFLISQVRQRANDIGKHPLLITAIAWVSPIYLILGFIPGQKQANKYGPVPNNR